MPHFPPEMCAEFAAAPALLKQCAPHLNPGPIALQFEGGEKATLEAVRAEALGALSQPFAYMQEDKSQKVCLFLFLLRKSSSLLSIIFLDMGYPFSIQPFLLKTCLSPITWLAALLLFFTSRKSKCS